MTRSTLLLAVTATALGLGTAYFYREYAALARDIALDRERCTQAIAHLKSEHQARIAELQQYLMQSP